MITILHLLFFPGKLKRAPPFVGTRLAVVGHASACQRPGYETSPGQIESVVGEGMPKVLEITYAGKRRSCLGLLVFRAELARREKQGDRSEEHTSELQSPCNLVCRLLLEKRV